MSRYAAKLLFQFRVEVNGESGKRRTCEERILNFRVQSARAALRSAKQRGRNAELNYTNSDGNQVFFEFIGVMDLLELGSESESDEVWYDIYDRVEPMERRARNVPSDESLLARVSWDAR